MAQNGGYGSGISISGDQATYTGYLDVSATNFDSNVTEVCLDCKTQQVRVCEEPLSSLSLLSDEAS